MSKSFVNYPLAVVDLEFTSLDPHASELIEIGALIVDQKEMKIVRTFETRISPAHIETADPESLHVAGYSDSDWQGAPNLKDALNKFKVFIGEMPVKYSGWNITLDWVLLADAFKQTEIENPFDYHVFDILGAATELFKNDTALEKISLAKTVKYFNLEKEPNPHRAINGARSAFEVLKKMREL